MSSGCIEIKVLTCAVAVANSLSSSRSSLPGDSDSLFDFPSPVNHLLSKLTKVIMILTEVCFNANQHNCETLFISFIYLFISHVPAAAHEVSICVLPGRGHVPPDQRLHAGHLDPVHAHQVAPPLGLLRQQPSRHRAGLRAWHAYNPDSDGPAGRKPVPQHPGTEPPVAAAAAASALIWAVLIPSWWWPSTGWQHPADAAWSPDIVSGDQTVPASSLILFFLFLIFYPFAFRPPSGHEQWQDPRSHQLGSGEAQSGPQAGVQTRADPTSAWRKR